MRRFPMLPYLVLLGGVLMVASASIMIRFAQQMGMPSMVIAAGRMGGAALILLPIALPRAVGEVRRLQGRALGLGLVAGVLLAVHFAAWISSLAYTSVASSVALVATNPLWVGLASVVVFRERLAPAIVVGIVLSIGGSALIGMSDGRGANAPNALFGDGLALLGALSGASYFLIGRALRRRMSILAYIWLVYSSAALLLVPIAWVAFGGGAALVTYPPMAFVLLLGLAIGPQLLGHTAFNWVLRYLSATFVSIAILGEPIGSALLALLLFHERFAPLQLVGFGVLLAGIVVASRAVQPDASQQS